jgi:hypothetical protein
MQEVEEASKVFDFKALLLCFSLDKPESMEHIKEWIEVTKYCNANVKLFVIGTHSDLCQDAQYL